MVLNYKAAYNEVKYNEVGIIKAKKKDNKYFIF